MDHCLPGIRKNTKMGKKQSLVCNKPDLDRSLVLPTMWDLKKMTRQRRDYY